VLVASSPVARLLSLAILQLPLLKSFLIYFLLLEEFFLYLRDIVKEDVYFIEVDNSVLGQVVSHARQEVLVDDHHGVYSALSDVQAGQMGQEIITNEKANEHKVINNPLEVVGKGQCLHQVFELKVQVFSDNIQLDELKLNRLG
jgi:hypothetical protein